MLNLLKVFCGAIDTTNEAVGRMVSWISLLLVLVVFVDVVMRYLFKTSFVFTQELVWHLFAFIFLIGAGYTLLHDGHVRMDIIYQRLGVKGRAWINSKIPLVNCSGAGILMIHQPTIKEEYCEKTRIY